ncbi:MAG: hypothetical protein CUN49_19845, partial [Candidatus Thermofonsia Clade 1 bacterium]
MDVIAPNRALVQAAARIRNLGETLFLTEERTQDNQRIALTFELPVGASAVRLAADSATRFRILDAHTPQPRLVSIAPL